VSADRGALKNRKKSRGAAAAAARRFYPARSPLIYTSDLLDY